MTTLSKRDLSDILEEVQETLMQRFIYEGEQETQINSLLEPCSQEQKRIIFDCLYSTGYVNTNNRLSLMSKLCDINVNMHVVSTKEIICSKQSQVFTSKHEELIKQQQYQDFNHLLDVILQSKDDSSLLQEIFLLVQEKDTLIANDIINFLKRTIG